MLTTRVPASLCPVCGYMLDSVESITNPDDKPDPGDFTVCMGCARVLQFDDRLIPFLPLADALECAFRDDPDARRAVEVTVRAIRHMHATVGPPGRQRGKAH